MERAAKGAKPKTDLRYTRFFVALGVADPAKVHKLAQLLQLVYDASSQLDGHLASVGASLHVAVSRMCEADNPLAPAQLRWIKVLDRLRFFCDSDEHSNRAVNIGLAYAYRHKELDALTAANALRLNDLRLSARPVRDNAPGGALHGLDSAIGTAAGPATDVTTGAPSAGIVAQPNADGGVGVESVNEDPSMVLPLGGVVVPRPGLGSGADLTCVPAPWANAVVPNGPNNAARSGAAVAAGNDLDLDDGGIVIARRVPDPPRVADGRADTHPTDGARSPAARSAGQAARSGQAAVSGEARAVVVVDECPTVVLSEQPLIKPSKEAVACVAAVIDGLVARADVREVLDKLVADSLLCLARLHGGMVASFSAGVVPASVELAWAGVRTLLHRWWPIWEADAAAQVLLAPPGTVSFLSHPGRRVRVSRWVVEVDKGSVNADIKRLEIPSSRYFKKESLPSSVPVVRVGPNTRPSICTSIATLLLVATKEPEFGGVVTQLSSMGRAPVSKDASLLGATCHDFETAGLGDPEAVVPPVGAPTAPRFGSPGAAAADGTSADRSGQLDEKEEMEVPVELGVTADMEGLHDEMEQLLEQEKAVEAFASRANRLAVRRLTRLEREPTLPASLQADSSPASVKRTRATPGTGGPPSATIIPPLEAVKRRRVGAGEPVSTRRPDLLTLLHLCPPRRRAVQRAVPGVPDQPPRSSGPGSLSEDRSSGAQRAQEGGHCRLPAGGTPITSGVAADPAREGGTSTAAAASTALPLGAAAGRVRESCTTIAAAAGTAMSPGDAAGSENGGTTPAAAAADAALTPSDIADSARGSSTTTVAASTFFQPGVAAGAAAGRLVLDKDARSSLADDKDPTTNCVTSLFAVPPTFQEFLASGGGDSMDGASCSLSSEDD